MRDFSEMIEIEIDIICRLFKQLNFKCIDKNNIYKEIESRNREILSKREYIFQNDRINVFLEVRNTLWNKGKTYLMIIRITNNTGFGLINLCEREFNFSSEEVSVIGDFFIALTVFIREYKKFETQEQNNVNVSSKERVV
jgi:hypothetical protein